MDNHDFKPHLLNSTPPFPNWSDMLPLSLCSLGPLRRRHQDGIRCARGSLKETHVKNERRKELEQARLRTAQTGLLWKDRRKDGGLADNRLTLGA